MEKNERRFFIRQYAGLDFTHGGRGYVDAEKILLREGYIPLEMPYNTDQRLIRKPARMAGLLRCLKAVKPGEEVVFLHPVFSGLCSLLVKGLVRKRAKLICIIGDISGIKFEDPPMLQRELELFRSIRYFVVHNPAMETWLLVHHPTAQVGVLDYFDFLAEIPALPRKKDLVIAYAGNLEKSGFLARLEELQSLGPQLLFNIYGQDPPAGMEMVTGVSYKGVYQPEQLPAQMEGAFGLVWDGDKLTESQGGSGYYLSLITHHKLSLYILAALPVIIYRLTASAPLVESAGIGIVIDSLYDLPARLALITEEQYQRMRERMAVLAPAISNGENLVNALEKISH